MKRVGFLTTFTSGSENGYSVTLVTERQLKLLLAHYYEPMVLVQENFQTSPTFWNRETIDLRPVVPFLHLTSGIAADFEERVAKIEQALVENLADCQVCITEDIFLLNVYKEHSIAVRRYAKKRPDLLWLHWLHSMPTPVDPIPTYPENTRYSAPPGYLVYPNNIDTPLVCQTYHLSGQEWRVKTMRHTIDPLDVVPLHSLTKILAGKADLLNGEIVIVYPSRPNPFKNIAKIIRLAAGIKASGVEPRVLFIDWQSAGAEFQAYLDGYLQLAQELDVASEVNFASRLDDSCSQGVPPRVVNELLSLSNVYIHPSQAETYSLTTHEAFLQGKLVVLNHDLPCLRELYGDAAMYMDFGSEKITRTYNPDEQTFWNDEAKRLIAEWKYNRALQGQLKARREWSSQAQWKNFEPLLYLQPVGE